MPLGQYESGKQPQHLTKRETITIIELVNTNSIYTIYYEEIIFDMQNILTGFSMEYVDAIIPLKKIDPSCEVHCITF